MIPSLQTIIRPPPTIPKIPGNNLSNGHSEKKTQPSAKAIGSPKYSNGAIRLGSTNLYPQIKKITPVPPVKPMIASKNKS